MRIPTFILLVGALDSNPFHASDQGRHPSLRSGTLSVDQSYHRRLTEEDEWWHSYRGLFDDESSMSIASSQEMNHAHGESERQAFIRSSMDEQDSFHDEASSPATIHQFDQPFIQGSFDEQGPFDDRASSPITIHQFDRPLIQYSMGQPSRLTETPIDGSIATLQPVSTKPYRITLKLYVNRHDPWPAFWSYLYFFRHMDDPMRLENAIFERCN